MFALRNASWLLTLAALIHHAVSTNYYPPEQIHINVGLTPDEMVFNWLTFDYPIETASFVLLGESPHPSDFTMNISGEATLFTDCGELQSNRTIHVVKVNNLKASTLYYYQVGAPHTGYSAVFSFTTPPNAATLSSSLPHHFIVYGDMGTTNTQACGPVTEMVLDGDINAIIHVGDMAYNMYENNGTRGDQFMRDISAAASYVPYMVAHGNHEAYYNFSHYTQRFRGQPLPAKPAPQTIYTQSGEAPNNWFYSFNYGLVHFVALSSEIYFDFPWLIPIQYEWLENDLQSANKNRTQAPWVVVYHHRPLYCSGTGSECDDQARTMRHGVLVNGSYEYSLEKVYYKYGVDFVYNGHVHNYERVYDVYKHDTDQKTTNMTATTYIVNGDAGNREGHHTFGAFDPSWSAYRTTTYSFSKFSVYNSTHIHLQQITADSELPPSEQGKVFDDVWFIQHNHGPFAEGAAMVASHDANKCVTYDPYKEYGIEMKIAEPEEDVPIPYISDNKDDYKGMDGVHF